MHIHFIATGGTIDKLYFDAASEYTIGTPQVGEILCELRPVFEWTIEHLMAKDSLDLNDDDRHLIFQSVAASGWEKIVITHGTDTMVQTAMELLPIAGKTIVFTGAMQPARFHRSDAIFNIGVAIGAVSCLIPGVYIAMNGQIFNPRSVRKNREKNCFEEIL